MAFFHRNSERKRIPHDFRRQEEEVVGSLCRLGSRPVSPKSLLEQEKRIRREIANSNERRRMQSINAGFQSLRALLPHREGEKLSKAAILQSTSDYVFQLEGEKTRLLEQNSELLRKLLTQGIDIDSDTPSAKRKKRESADMVDEGIGSLSPSRNEEDTKREMISLRLQLEHERTLRMLLKDRVRDMEQRLYPIEGKDSGDSIHSQYHSEAEDNKPINLGHESGLGSPQSPISNPDIESTTEMSLRESSPDLSSAEIPEDLSGKTTLFPCPIETAIMMPSPPLSAASSPFPDHMANIPMMFKKVNGRTVLATIIEDHMASFKTLTRQNAIVEDTPLELPGIQYFKTRPEVEDIPPVPKIVNRQDMGAVVEDKVIRQEVVEDNVKSFKTTASTSRQNLDTIVEAIRHVEGDHMFRDDEAPKQEEQMMEDVVPGQQLNSFSFQHQIIMNAPLVQSRPGVIVSHLS